MLTPTVGTAARYTYGLSQTVLFTATVPPTWPHRAFLPLVARYGASGPAYPAAPAYPTTGQPFAVLSTTACPRPTATPVSARRGWASTTTRPGSTAMGRFAQADTLVPEAGNPQSFNRYSYTYNNPIKYCDPLGHCAISSDGKPDPSDQKCWGILINLQDEYGITIVNHERWTTDSLSWLSDVFLNYENWIGREVFKQYVAGTNFLVESSIGATAEWQPDRNAIVFHPEKAAFNGEWNIDFTQMILSPQNAFAKYSTHELVHLLVYRFGEKDLPYKYGQAVGWEKRERYFLGIRWSIFRLKSEWENPQSGPTEYARFTRHPEEDLADSLTALMVPGIADREITPARQKWIQQWIAQMNR